MSRPLNPKIFDFILANVEEHGDDLARLTAKRFRISRTTAANYLRRLVEDGVIRGEGNTRARRYEFVATIPVSLQFEVTPDLAEDVLWRTHVFPALQDLPDNVRTICQHGFTEMVNNVIDHSGSETCDIEVRRTPLEVTLSIRDYGVGVFEKIRGELGLLDRRHAILELSKGKLTTDEARHSGEGIFFTCRMFTSFMLESLDLAFISSQEIGGDWLLEVEDSEESVEGTLAVMTIAPNAEHTIQEVFARYTDDQARFSKTQVPITLARYEGEQLVSRSQAKRLLTRVERFAVVLLDFRNVEMIGQAFADEIFRVFAREHPEVEIMPINETDEVRRMIQRTTRTAEK